MPITDRKTFEDCGRLVMTQRPLDVFEADDWRFLAQPRVESQWFERKAHPPDRPPRDLKTFRTDRMARPICGFANSNPGIGGLLVIGIADGGQVHGVDRFGLEYQNELM